MGDMDPLAEQAGVVKRLSNLGFPPDWDGLPEEVVAELLPAAIKSFQRSRYATKGAAGEWSMK